MTRSPSAVFVLGLALAAPAFADDSVREARETVSLFEKTDPGMSRFIAGSAGYAVFRSVGKGGIGLGGAYGTGVLFEKGRAVGKTTLTQITIGLQLGGQAYSEIIFFQDAGTLADFKKGEFAFAAQVSAVAATAGAAANAKYRQGVAVFTMAKGGLMYEASVGGQKFGYEPLGKK